MKSWSRASDRLEKKCGKLSPVYAECGLLFGRIYAKRNYVQVGKMGYARQCCIRNNVKVRVVPFGKMEKYNFELNQKELSAKI